MTELKIFLENNSSAVFYPGQKIKGTIELHLDEPLEINGLFFIINGEAATQWTSSDDEHKQFSGKEVYFNEKAYLVAQNEGQSHMMQAETFHYKFEAELPSNIPASFEKFGKYYGCIRYDISAYLEVSQEVQKECKISFFVLNDLNEFSDIKIPCKETLFKKFCCLFCKSEPLTLSVIIPYSGYTPGSTIPIMIRYNNESEVEIGRTIITVLCVAKYKSSIPYKKSKLEEEKVVEVFREGVKPSESKSFVENLSLPDGLSNTNDSYCGIIQVTYYLIVEPEAIGCHYGFKICMPIIIGSVPLNFHENDQNHSTFDMRTDREDSAAQNVLVRCPSLSSLSPNNEVSDFPPPSYEEATKLQRDWKD